MPDPIIPSAARLLRDLEADGWPVLRTRLLRRLEGDGSAAAQLRGELEGLAENDPRALFLCDAFAEAAHSGRLAALEPALGTVNLRAFCYKASAAALEAGGEERAAAVIAILGRLADWRAYRGPEPLDSARADGWGAAQATVRWILEVDLTEEAREPVWRALAASFAAAPVAPEASGLDARDLFAAGLAEVLGGRGFPAAELRRRIATPGIAAATLALSRAGFFRRLRGSPLHSPALEVKRDLYVKARAEGTRILCEDAILAGLDLPLLEELVREAADDPDGPLLPALTRLQKSGSREQAYRIALTAAEELRKRWSPRLLPLLEPALEERDGAVLALLLRALRSLPGEALGEAIVPVVERLLRLACAVTRSEASRGSQRDAADAILCLALERTLAADAAARFPPALVYALDSALLAEARTLACGRLADAGIRELVCRELEAGNVELAGLLEEHVLASGDLEGERLLAAWAGVYGGAVRERDLAARVAPALLASSPPLLPSCLASLEQRGAHAAIASLLEDAPQHPALPLMVSALLRDAVPETLKKAWRPAIGSLRGLFVLAGGETDPRILVPAGLGSPAEERPGIGRFEERRVRDLAKRALVLLLEGYHPSRVEPWFYGKIVAGLDALFPAPGARRAPDAPAPLPGHARGALEDVGVRRALLELYLGIFDAGEPSWAARHGRPHPHEELMRPLRRVLLDAMQLPLDGAPTDLTALAPLLALARAREAGRDHPLSGAEAIAALRALSEPKSLHVLCQALGASFTPLTLDLAEAFAAREGKARFHEIGNLLGMLRLAARGMQGGWSAGSGLSEHGELGVGRYDRAVAALGRIGAQALRDVLAEARATTGDGLPPVRLLLTASTTIAAGLMQLENELAARPAPGLTTGVKETIDEFNSYAGPAIIQTCANFHETLIAALLEVDKAYRRLMVPRNPDSGALLAPLHELAGLLASLARDEGLPGALFEDFLTRVLPLGSFPQPEQFRLYARLAMLLATLDSDKDRRYALDGLRLAWLWKRRSGRDVDARHTTALADLVEGFLLPRAQRYAASGRKQDRPGQVLISASLLFEHAREVYDLMHDAQARQWEVVALALFGKEVGHEQFTAAMQRFFLDAQLSFHAVLGATWAAARQRLGGHEDDAGATEGRIDGILVRLDRANDVARENLLAFREQVGDAAQAIVNILEVYKTLGDLASIFLGLKSLASLGTALGTGLKTFASYNLRRQFLQAAVKSLTTTLTTIGKQMATTGARERILQATRSALSLNTELGKVAQGEPVSYSTADSWFGFLGSLGVPLLAEVDTLTLTVPRFVNALTSVGS